MVIEIRVNAIIKYAIIVSIFSSKKKCNNNRIIIEQWLINVRTYAIWCVKRGFHLNPHSPVITTVVEYVVSGALYAFSSSHFASVAKCVCTEEWVLNALISSRLGKTHLVPHLCNLHSCSMSNNMQSVRACVCAALGILIIIIQRIFESKERENHLPMRHQTRTIRFFAEGFFVSTTEVEHSNG